MNSGGTFSPKLAVLAAFACISFVLGIFLRNDLVFACIPVVLYIGFLSVQSGEVSDVSVKRAVEKAQLAQGDSCKVRLRVTNTGKRSIALITIADSVPSDLRSDRASFR